MANIETIADSGNDLELLKALRQKLAKTLDESKSGRDIATLSRQLQIVMLEISEYEKTHKYDPDATTLEIIRKKHAKVRPDKETINEDY